MQIKVAMDISWAGNKAFSRGSREEESQYWGSNLREGKGLSLPLQEMTDNIFQHTSPRYTVGETRMMER